MKAPICLVGNWKEQLMVNPEAVQILDKISQPLVVVAIVGLYRTGKSYLMNRLAGQNHGFPLGSTVQSKTKGIWMWCVPHPTKPSHTLVLLDTEGLGDVEKGDPKNDSWIFALAVLLSSTFVYNSMGTINHQALEQLHYVTELTQLIQAKTNPSHDEAGDSSEFMSCFPDFVWTVRDFMLELQLDGRPITEDEYLENALKLIPGENPQVQNANKSRECIKYFFQERKCFVFDRPTSNRKLLSQIEKLPENQLEWDFQVEAKNFCSYIFANAKIKTLSGGIAVTGKRLGSLVKTYVDAINNGTVPCLENAMRTLAQHENSAAMQMAADYYSKQMVQHLWLPTDTLQELLDVHANCKREAITVFLEHSFKDDKQEFQKRLVATIEKKKKDFLLQNETASLTHCQVKLQKFSEPLMQRISRGDFCVPGGYSLYLRAKKKVEWQYKQVPRKGVKANDVLQSFLQSQATIENSIRQSDKALTDGQRALTVARMKKEVAQKKQQLLRQQRKRQQQEMNIQEGRFQKNVVQLSEKMGRPWQTLQRKQGEMRDRRKEHNVQRLCVHDHPRNRSSSSARPDSPGKTDLWNPEGQRPTPEQASGFRRNRRRQGNRPPAFGRPDTAGGTGLKLLGDQKQQQEKASSFSGTRDNRNRSLVSDGAESAKGTGARPLWYQKAQHGQVSVFYRTRAPHTTKPLASAEPETARKTDLWPLQDKRTQHKHSSNFSRNREYHSHRSPGSDTAGSSVQTDHHLLRDQRAPRKQASGFCRTREHHTNRPLDSAGPESSAQTDLVESTRKLLESTRIY